MSVTRDDQDRTHALKMIAKNLERIADALEGKPATPNDKEAAIIADLYKMNAGPVLYSKIVDIITYEGGK